MRKFNVAVNGISYSVEVEEIGGAAAVAAPAPAVVAAAPAAVAAATPAAPIAAAAAVAAGDVRIDSPLPGNVWKINISVGQAVKKGDVLMILEAMKMENDISAPQDGTIKGIHVNLNDAVNTGDLLISM